ncbi:MAG: ABC transporter substrate-binding protein [Proteobacteria bacterium]|nr:ABC transporter substrate-binding protein [Pseudomonadota bacterium]
MIRTILHIKILFLLAFIFISPAVKAAELTASEVVERFQASLLDIMKEANTLSVQQRYVRLQASVEKSFHLPLMVQIASADHWKESTTAERRHLVNAFRRMSISTLATLFNGYSGEVFELIVEKPGPQNTTLVVTKLVKSDKSTVEIAYVTRPFKKGWRIIDVILDNGISELMVRRSEYRQILKNKGIAGLITVLNSKADELVSQ